MKSKLVFSDRFPSPNALAEHPILIFDSFLLKNKNTKKWIESFPHRIEVKAGESLKQFKQFEKHFIDVLRIVEQTKIKNISLIGLGGGSVGDFVGFMASVFKRGVPLIHIPSTWLAAIDSAHGGKTALNVAGYKNQIGTFYKAEQIFLIKSLLENQPEERVYEAMGEVLKTVLLNGGALWKKTRNQSSFSKTTLWKILPDLIAYKYKIVNQDPYETKGIRFFLNFGHTFGHVLESIHQLPHGVAVNYGLRLALDFSLQKKILSQKEYDQINNNELIIKYLFSSVDAINLIKKTPKLEKHLLQDKKSSEKNKIRFVFLRKIGKPVVKVMTTQELIAFSKNSRLV